MSNANGSAQTVPAITVRIGDEIVRIPGVTRQEWDEQVELQGLDIGQQLMYAESLIDAAAQMGYEYEVDPQIEAAVDLSPESNIQEDAEMTTFVMEPKIAETVPAPSASVQETMQFVTEKSATYCAERFPALSPVDVLELEMNSPYFTFVKFDDVDAIRFLKEANATFIERNKVNARSMGRAVALDELHGEFGVEYVYDPSNKRADINGYVKAAAYRRADGAEPRFMIWDADEFGVMRCVVVQAAEVQLLTGQKVWMVKRHPNGRAVLNPFYGWAEGALARENERTREWARKNGYGYTERESVISKHELTLRSLMRGENFVMIDNAVGSYRRMALEAYQEEVGKAHHCPVEEIRALRKAL